MFIQLAKAAALAIFAIAAGKAIAADGPALAAARRQPIALVFSADGSRLFVANRANGTISTIDVHARKVLAESAVGQRLEDLAALDDRQHWLTIDSARNELLLLRREGESFASVRSLEVPLDPVRLSVAKGSGESFVAVTSRWGNRVTVLRCVADDGNTQQLLRDHIFTLPFSPRALLWLDAGRTLVVADAFGGRIAVLDVANRKLASLRTIPAHNIEAMTFDHTRSHMIITQQFLNHRSETTADSIHWGFLLTNSIRSLRLADLLDPKANLVAGSHLAHLGEPGHGGGDPTGIVVLPNDDVLTTLAGVNEVAIGQTDAPDRLRIAVGTRPTSVALSPDGKTACTANTLDDFVSFIDIASKRTETVSLGPRPALTDIDRGERLFYDARLSHEGWMSCQSCHGDGHTNGRLADTLGDGSFGAPKLVISLLGTADTAPFAWNGGIADLETQVRKSIKTTLRQNEPTDEQVHDLTTFLRTLKPPPPPIDLDAASVGRGEAIFTARKCARCHAPPTYTSPKTYDVGLSDEAEQEKYNPPSLRGAGRRDSFLHDARARSLDEVFQRFGHPNDSTYTDREAADLSSFLKSR